MKQKHKTPCRQQWINLEMQRQINKLNLCAEFRFKLVFDMKTLFYFKLRISAGMIENLKTSNITLRAVFNWVSKKRGNQNQNQNQLLTN